MRESFDKLCRQVSGFGDEWSMAGSEFALTIHRSQLTNNTVARQPMSFTWFPFNAGGRPGNLYSD